mgnify:FL=1
MSSINTEEYESTSESVIPYTIHSDGVEVLISGSNTGKKQPEWRQLVQGVQRRVALD